MVKKFWKWWFKQDSSYVVELPKEYDAGYYDEDSVRSLAGHPGFVSLITKFNLQRAAIRAKLEDGNHTSLRDVDRLQLGLQWLGYMETEVKRAIGKKAEAKAVAARPFEQVEFDKVIAFYEGV